MENYAIILKNSTSEEGNSGEKMIGILGIPRLSPSGAAAEVGYALLPEYWGMGYASEALILFRTYYFNSTRPVQKATLLAKTEPKNVASERVLSKAGFKRVGFVKGAFEVVDFRTGEKGMRDATEWRFTREQLE